jgi:hypothetical protein
MTTMHAPKRRLVVPLVLVLLAALALTLGSVRAAAETPTAHFITNLKGSTAPAALSYDVFDTSPSGVTSLPDGVRGMVWLGQKCPTPADDAFRSTIDSLSANPRVFGYYLSDEPHIADCPDGPAALRSRVDYIKTKTTSQYTFVVISKQVDIEPFKPANTGLDLIGLDPYPCSISNPTCDLRKIGERVGWADAAGIPRSQLVPTFQAFGQENTTSHYYNLPTADQMRAMLAEWAKFLPAPVMDYSYGWGHQSSSNPTLVDSPELQAVMAEHNESVPAPEPTVTTSTPATTTTIVSPTPTKTKKPRPTHPHKQ